MEPVTDLPVLSYNGTSGWSGSDTSRERAESHDASGRTRIVQQRLLFHLSEAGYRGLTWKEAENLLLEEGVELTEHSSVSSNLSNLHKAGHIARLSKKRLHRKVYVTTKYLGTRKSEPQGVRRHHSCPRCQYEWDD